MIARQRSGQRLLVDDLAARDVDEHAARLHQSETIGVEKAVRLGRPLAADDDKIAVRQKPVELCGAAELAEPGRKLLARLRMTAGAHYPHAERGAESADITPDATGADDTHGLAFNQKGPVGAVIEGARATIDDSVVQEFGEIENAGYGILRHRERAAHAARGRHRNIAAP